MNRPSKPTFGFILLGGTLTGALVRDVRLANELADRGYHVAVWWIMDRPTTGDMLRPSVRQYWLAHGLRYSGVPRGLREAFGRLLTRLISDRRRSGAVQKRPHWIDALMRALTLHVVAGVERDPAVIRRFASQMDEVGVTHMLPMLGLLCPFALEARKHMKQPARLAVTFQGYELYANYARAAGCEAELYRRLREVVAASDYPAIAVSSDYVERVITDIGVERGTLVAMPPGVPLPRRIGRDEALTRIARRWPQYRPGVPLVSFLGRMNTEKGIDLLLYAAKILEQRGVDLQLLICGPTSFGKQYRIVLQELVANLRLTILKAKHVPEDIRQAVLAGSDCVVYPSIHREPFGMVAAEALSFGTPALVPDYGGVAGAIEGNGAVGGLTFKVWDSGDLADQLQKLITDRDLWQRLADAGPTVAEFYSVARLADRMLDHLGLAESADASPASGGAARVA